jgi:hypothetical protein
MGEYGPDDSVEVHSPIWDPLETLKALQEETEALDHGDETRTADRLFRAGLPVAAAAVVHIAQHCPNEKTRLDAARYVVERNLGQLKDVLPQVANDPFEELLGDIVRTIDDDSTEEQWHTTVQAEGQ